jgi:hypothetical protein
MQLLANVLAQMAQGHAVTVTPIQEELTPQQATSLKSHDCSFAANALYPRDFP